MRTFWAFFAGMVTLQTLLSLVWGARWLTRRDRNRWDRLVGCSVEQLEWLAREGDWRATILADERAASIRLLIDQEDGVCVEKVMAEVDRRRNLEPRYAQSKESNSATEAPNTPASMLQPVTYDDSVELVERVAWKTIDERQSPNERSQ